MAMSAGAAAVAGRRRHRRRPVMSEINVTPMVDVMLVLLIIFMVSAPLMVHLIPVNLPEARAGGPETTTELQLAVTLRKSGGACSSTSDLYFSDNPQAGDIALPLSELDAKLKQVKASTPQLSPNVKLRADRDTCHADFMRLLGRIKDAGFGADIAVVPEKEGQ
jgi:biopolymer transport protein ExbD/biopolymer transport protein TolR